MAESKTRYDEETRTLWVYRKYDQPQTLLPGAEIQQFSKQRQAGETEEGQPLNWVNIVFGDEQTAAYNHQPLTFSKLGVFVGDLNNPTRYQSEDGEPSFDTRSDFGIE